MRYFVPTLRLSPDLPPQDLLQDKLGGLPWGLSPNRWPKCATCGKSQSLLAQFVHDRVRLDLGRSGRVLSVFQCNHDPGMCSTWEGGSGSNACFVTEPEDLLPGLATLPVDLPPIEREARILGWLDRDDGIDEPTAEHFYSWAAYSKLSDEEVAKAPICTRLGGVPSWLQSPDEAPKDQWRFIGQLDNTYRFIERPSSGSPGIFEAQTKKMGHSYICEGPNFGDGGIAYLFLRDTSTTPEGWFFWQCC